MKTLILSAFVALTSLTVSASGSKEKSVASFRCIQNFEKEFGYVEDVKWTGALNNMTRADFVLDDENFTAYFDDHGDFVASTNSLKFNELPKALRAAITNKFPQVKITNAFKVTSPTEVSYYFETELDGERKLYKGREFGDFTRFYVKNY